MNSTSYLTLNCLLEAVKLFVVIFGIIGFRLCRRRYIAPAMLALAGLVFLLASYIDLSEYTFIIHIATVALVMQFAQGRKRMLFGFAAYAGVCIIDTMSSLVVMAAMDVAATGLYKSGWLALACDCISLPLLVAMWLFARRRKHGITLAECANTWQIVVFIAGCLFCGIFITPLQMFVFNAGEMPASFNNTIALAAGLSGFTFVLLGFSLGRSNVSMLHLKNQSEINRLICESQERYLQTIMQRDTDIARFRHDFAAHMYCMATLCKNSQHEQLAEYIEQVNGTLEASRLTLDTGDPTVNAVVSYVFSTNVTDTQLRWNGRLPPLNAPLADVCVIFSNLLENAVDACKLVDDRERVVTVDVKRLGGSTAVRICNPTSAPPEIRDGRLITSKSEPERHGFGSVNAQECVARLGGVLDYKCDGLVFSVSLMLPCQCK